VQFFNCRHTLAEFLRRHGLKLHGTPDYHRDDSAHNKRFPTKTALDPFHPADDEDFIHRLDWDQPHCNKLGGFFQPVRYILVEYSLPNYTS
jgi:hypothetical protein